MDIITFVTENATKNNWTEFVVSICIVAGLCYLIYKESKDNKLCKWENKVWKYIAAFFKSLFYTISDELRKVH